MSRTGRAVGESGELDKAVRKGEGERWVWRAPSPFSAQEDPAGPRSGRMEGRAPGAVGLKGGAGWPVS
eukprot:1155379-Pyramimonas_sp.AAC.1